MTCESEHTFECLTSKRDYHWFWILVPIGLAIVCLLYILSRPNYARLPLHTYQRIIPSKNIISLYPQKQQGYAFNQHAKCSTPTSSPRCLFEQCKERTIEKHTSALQKDNTKYKTSTFLTFYNLRM